MGNAGQDFIIGMTGHLLVNGRVETFEIDHGAIDNGGQHVPRARIAGTIGIDECCEVSQRWVGVDCPKQVAQERRLLCCFATRCGDPADEWGGPPDLCQQFSDGRSLGSKPIQRIVAGDGLGIVTGNAIKIAALQEHHKPIAGTINVAKRDRVSNKAVSGGHVRGN